MSHVCLMIAAIALSAEPPAEKPEAVARASAKEFTATHAKGDKAAILKLMDVPWFDYNYMQTISDRKRLESDYDELFFLWSKPFPKEVASVRRYAEVRKKMDEKGRKLFDRVLKEEDFIVQLGEGPKVERFILVRIRDGKAKIVGIAAP